MIERMGIEKIAKFDLYAGEGNPIGINVKMNYDSRDPYAVEFNFLQEPNPIKWIFGRELLDDGLKAKSGELVGEGDISIGTDIAVNGDEEREVAVIGLSSDNGAAVLEVDKNVIVDFLKKTQNIVPMGEESKWYNLDKEIKKGLEYNKHIQEEDLYPEVEESVKPIELPDEKVQEEAENGISKLEDMLFEKNKDSEE
jgi:hypothetical protein